MNKLIIFDLDGTLAESKQPLTSEMAVLVEKLLAVTRVAVISGGALEQFLKQVVNQLPKSANFANLFLLPTSGAALYEFHPSTSLRTSNGGWDKVYEERLSEKEAETISSAMQAAAKQTCLIDFNEPAYGERIEYRGGDVTLSALGQVNAPIAEKRAWDPDHSKRHVLRDAIAELLPTYSVSIGGATSIDVTKKGIDKAYGVHKLCERLGIAESDALYIGDELEAGGNDEAVYKTAVQTKPVANPAETALFLESLISNQ